VDFYSACPGLDDVVFDCSGPPESLGFEQPEQRSVSLVNHRGGRSQAVTASRRDDGCRGSWGHLGPMEFGIDVSTLEVTCDQAWR
jgi:hypothetical protein